MLEQVKIQAHVPIHLSRKYTADFLLSSGEQQVHIEVLGMLLSHENPKNAEKEAYLRRQEAKLGHYALHGLEPIIIHGDALADPGRLRDILKLIYQRLQTPV